MSMPSNDSGRGSNDLFASEALSRRAPLSRTSAVAALLAAGPVLAARGGPDSTTSGGTSSGGSSTTGAGGEVGGNLEIYVWEGDEANVPARKAWAKKNGITMRASSPIRRRSSPN